MHKNTNICYHHEPLCMRYSVISLTVDGADVQVDLAGEVYLPGQYFVC